MDLGLKYRIKEGKKNIEFSDFGFISLLNNNNTLTLLIIAGGNNGDECSSTVNYLLIKNRRDEINETNGISLIIRRVVNGLPIVHFIGGDHSEKMHFSKTIDEIMKKKDLIEWGK